MFVNLCEFMLISVYINPVSFSAIILSIRSVVIKSLLVDYMILVAMSKVYPRPKRFNYLMLNNMPSKIPLLKVIELKLRYVKK